MTIIEWHKAIIVTDNYFELHNVSNAIMNDLRSYVHKKATAAKNNCEASVILVLGKHQRVKKSYCSCWEQFKFSGFINATQS